MNRNPNNLSPRTMRDCTFQDWADPIQKPEPRTHWAPVVCAWLIATAAAVVIVWRAVA